MVPFESYLAWGDRCEASEKPDAELAHLVSDLAGWDQVIVTPSGQEVPDLEGKLDGKGLRREAMGIKAFKQAVKSVEEGINTDFVYTFCFWGVSRVVDFDRWQFNFSPMKVKMDT